jgi:hypothetical protein
MGWDGAEHAVRERHAPAVHCSGRESCHCWNFASNGPEFFRRCGIRTRHVLRGAGTKRLQVRLARRLRRRSHPALRVLRVHTWQVPYGPRSDTKYFRPVRLHGSGARGLGQNVVPVENNLRRWDPFTDDYRWEAAQIYEGNPNGNDRSNHGLGISVIIYHPDLQLYTLYGHLDAVIEGLQPDSWVEAGDVIGRMGNSGSTAARLRR